MDVSLGKATCGSRSSTPRLLANTRRFGRINNGYDTVTWDKVLSIKQTVLRLWDNAVASVKISCIKFAQRVVLAQTASSGAEHRVRSSTVESCWRKNLTPSQQVGTLDVSLDKVPPNHQSLDTRNLEAEASGLLDRMLSVLQEST